MKNLLNLDEIMSKEQVNMEKLVLAYIIGFLIGEQVRDQAYSGSRKWEQLCRSIHPAQTEDLASQRSSGGCLHTSQQNCLRNVRTHV